MLPSPALNAVVASLYDAAFQLPLLRFHDFVFAQIATLIPFESGVWESMASDAIELRSYGLNNLDATTMEALAVEHGRDNPFRNASRAAPGRTFRLSDVMPDSVYRALPAYAEKGKDMGMDHALGTTHPCQIEGVSEWIAIWRSDASGPFSDEERAMMETLAPHIVAAWYQRQMIGLFKAAFGFDDMALHEGRAHAVVDQDFVIRATIGDFGPRLREVFGRWKGPKLPDEIRELIRNGPYMSTIGRFEIAIGPVGDRYNIVITPASQPNPLGRNEMRTAELFAGGASYREIAETLGISAFTVRNQISSAYRKLGVHSKVSLAEAIRYKT